MGKYYYGYTVWADSYSVFDAESKNEWGDPYCVVPLVTKDEAIRCAKCLNEGKDAWDWKREVAHVAGHVALGQEAPEPMPLSVRFYALHITPAYPGPYVALGKPCDTLEEAQRGSERSCLDINDFTVFVRVGPGLTLVVERIDTNAG